MPMEVDVAAPQTKSPIESVSFESGGRLLGEQEQDELEIEEPPTWEEMREAFDLRDRLQLRLDLLKDEAT